MMNNFIDSADKEIAIQKKYSKAKMAATSIKDSGYGFAQGLGLYLYIVQCYLIIHNIYYYI